MSFWARVLRHAAQVCPADCIDKDQIMLKRALAVALSFGLLLAPNVLCAQAIPDSNGTGSAAVSLPGYLLVVGKTTDRAKIASYASALPPIYARHNAYYLAIGSTGRGVTWLEGPWRDRSIIFGKFPSREEIDAFWWGPDYREAIRRRDNAGVFSVVAMSGTAPTSFEGSGVGFLIVMTARRDASNGQKIVSERASQVLAQGVSNSGGVLLVSSGEGQFTPLEGDTVFDRFTIASWPTLAQRDAYLASPAGRRAAHLRSKLGISAVASANGVAAAAPPPATVPIVPR